MQNDDDFYYLLNPGDLVVLRNAIEPIVLQFVMKVLEGIIGKVEEMYNTEDNSIEENEEEALSPQNLRKLKKKTLMR